MKAFLIDPKARTIEEVEYDDSDYRNIYKFIDCQTFTVAPINEHTTDDVYVDDEGLMTNERPLYAFQFLGGHQPLVGKGLVVGGPDDEGRNTPPNLTLDELLNITHFGTIG
jgi:hypothetical protein